MDFEKLVSPSPTTMLLNYIDVVFHKHLKPLHLLLLPSADINCGNGVRAALGSRMQTISQRKNIKMFLKYFIPAVTENCKSWKSKYSHRLFPQQEENNHSELSLHS